MTLASESYFRKKSREIKFLEGKFKFFLKSLTGLAGSAGRIFSMARVSTAITPSGIPPKF